MAIKVNLSFKENKRYACIYIYFLVNFNHFCLFVFYDKTKIESLIRRQISTDILRGKML